MSVPHQVEPRELLDIDSELPNDTRDKLKWELEEHLSLFKFYSDLALKAVGLFAAIVGAILSIYFGKDADPYVKRFLLQAIFVMSLIMGSLFIGCGALWFRTALKAKQIAKKLEMIRFPDVIYLSYLLWLFGILFFVVAGGLDWLKSRVL